jgi:hypothetical protein
VRAAQRLRLTCRDEVAAAFERLRTSGLAYRKETIYVVSDQQTFHETSEFLPPDRMRQITTNGVPSYGTVETVRVGPRAWSNERASPYVKEEWHEWEPGLAEEIYSAGMDFSARPDRAVPVDTAFECLGRVELKGKVHIGYRTRLANAVTTVGPVSEKDEQELLSRLRQMPQHWRTVLLDWPSMLPAYDIVAQESQLDNPRSSEHYTYPDDIKIEPPLQ